MLDLYLIKLTETYEKQLGGMIDWWTADRELSVRQDRENREYELMAAKVRKRLQEEIRSAGGGDIYEQKSACRDRYAK